MGFFDKQNLKTINKKMATLGIRSYVRQIPNEYRPDNRDMLRASVDDGVFVDLTENDREWFAVIVLMQNGKLQEIDDRTILPLEIRAIEPPNKVAVAFAELLLSLEEAKEKFESQPEADIIEDFDSEPEELHVLGKNTIIPGWNDFDDDEEYDDEGETVSTKLPTVDDFRDMSLEELEKELSPEVLEVLNGMLNTARFQMNLTEDDFHLFLEEMSELLDAYGINAEVGELIAKDADGSWSAAFTGRIGELVEYEFVEYEGKWASRCITMNGEITYTSFPVLWGPRAATILLVHNLFVFLSLLSKRPELAKEQKNVINNMFLVPIRSLVSDSSKSIESSPEVQQMAKVLLDGLDKI